MERTSSRTCAIGYRHGQYIMGGNSFRLTNSHRKCISARSALPPCSKRVHRCRCQYVVQGTNASRRHAPTPSISDRLRPAYWTLHRSFFAGGAVYSLKVHMYNHLQTVLLALGPFTSGSLSTWPRGDISASQDVHTLCHTRWQGLTVMSNRTNVRVCSNPASSNCRDWPLAY